MSPRCAARVEEHQGADVGETFPLHCDRQVAWPQRAAFQRDDRSAFLGERVMTSEVEHAGRRVEQFDALGQACVHAPVADVYREDAADAVDLGHPVGRRVWRDDVGGAAIQAQDPRPALAVDAADDGELLDGKAVVVVAVDLVEEFPGHSDHVAGDGEQPDPVALSPELAPDCLGHDICP